MSLGVVITIAVAISVLTLADFVTLKFDRAIGRTRLIYMVPGSLLLASDITSLYGIEVYFIPVLLIILLYSGFVGSLYVLRWNSQPVSKQVDAHVLNYFNQYLDDSQSQKLDQLFSFKVKAWGISVAILTLLGTIEPFYGSSTALVGFQYPFRFAPLLTAAIFWVVFDWAKISENFALRILVFDLLDMVLIPITGLAILAVISYSCLIIFVMFYNLSEIVYHVSGGLLALLDFVVILLMRKRVKSGLDWTSRLFSGTNKINNKTDFYRYANSYRFLLSRFSFHMLVISLGMVILIPLMQSLFFISTGVLFELPLTTTDILIVFALFVITIISATVQMYYERKRIVSTIARERRWV